MTTTTIRTIPMKTTVNHGEAKKIQRECNLAGVAVSKQIRSLIMCWADEQAAERERDCSREAVAQRDKHWDRPNDKRGKAESKGTSKHGHRYQSPPVLRPSYGVIPKMCLRV